MKEINHLKHDFINMKKLTKKYCLEKIIDSNDKAIFEGILSDQTDDDTALNYIKLYHATNHLIDWNKFDTKNAWDKIEPQIKTKNKVKWIRYAAIAAIFIFSIFAIKFINSDNFENESSTSSDYLVLVDGSDIILKNGSTLDLLSNFNSSNRVVELKGSGYFNIAKNPASPFIILSKGKEITVLGTEFYVDETVGGIKVNLIEGRVKIKNYDGVTVLLTDKQTAIVDDEIKIEKLNSKIDETGVYEDLKFDDVTVNAAIDSLNSIYRKEVLVLNEDIKNIGTETIHATIRNSSVRDFTRLMEIVFDANVINSKGQFIISSK